MKIPTVDKCVNPAKLKKYFNNKKKKGPIMSLDSLGNIGLLVAVGAVGFFLLLVLREVTLWYFRINEIVDLLKKQTELLEAIASDRRPNVSKPIITPTSPPARNPLTGK